MLDMLWLYSDKFSIRNYSMSATFFCRTCTVENYMVGPSHICHQARQPQRKPEVNPRSQRAATLPRYISWLFLRMNQ